MKFNKSYSRVLRTRHACLHASSTAFARLAAVRLFKQEGAKNTNAWRLRSSYDLFGL